MQPEDVWHTLDELRGQRGEPVSLSLTIPIVEEDGLPLHIAEVTESLLEGYETWCRMLLGGGFQHTNPGDFLPHWLRRGGERRCDQAQDEHDEATEDATPHGRLLKSALC
jgi:hypothetical protein